MQPRLHVTYRVHSEARAIEARARAIAVEQSVEMPVAAIEDAFVRSEIIGQVEAIREQANGWFEVTMHPSLSRFATFGCEHDRPGRSRSNSSGKHKRPKF